MKLRHTILAIIALLPLFAISLAAQTGNFRRVPAGSVHRLANAANGIG